MVCPRVHGVSGPQDPSSTPLAATILRLVGWQDEATSIGCDSMNVTHIRRHSGLRQSDHGNAIHRANRDARIGQGEPTGHVPWIRAHLEAEGTSVAPSAPSGHLPCAGIWSLGFRAAGIGLPKFHVGIVAQVPSSLCGCYAMDIGVIADRCCRQRHPKRCLLSLCNCDLDIRYRLYFVPAFAGIRQPIVHGNLAVLLGCRCSVWRKGKEARTISRDEGAE